jgi:hypothetical protein
LKRQTGSNQALQSDGCRAGDSVQTIFSDGKKQSLSNKLHNTGKVLYFKLAPKPFSIQQHSPAMHFRCKINFKKELLGFPASWPDSNPDLLFLMDFFAKSWSAQTQTIKQN